MKSTNKRVAESLQDGITRRVRLRVLAKFAKSNARRLISKFKNLKNHDLEKTVNFEEKVKGTPLEICRKWRFFWQSNIGDNMSQKQLSVIPLWYPHFSLKYNIFYHYLLCEKRDRLRIITKFMDFFLKNAFRRMKKTPKIV